MTGTTAKQMAFRGLPPLRVFRDHGRGIVQGPALTLVVGQLFDRHVLESQGLPVTRFGRLTEKCPLYG